MSASWGWSILLLLTLSWVTSLRLTVRWFRPADNGWDNTVAQTMVMGALVYPVGYLVDQGAYGLAAAPFLVALTHWASLRVIYELRGRTALGLGLVQASLFAVMASLSAGSVATMAAYIWYGRLVTDPALILRMVVRLVQHILG